MGKILIIIMGVEYLAFGGWLLYTYGVNINNLWVGVSYIAYGVANFALAQMVT